LIGLYAIVGSAIMRRSKTLNVFFMEITIAKEAPRAYGARGFTTTLLRNDDPDA
jgi:hypothetical protein